MAHGNAITKIKVIQERFGKKPKIILEPLTEGPIEFSVEEAALLRDHLDNAIRDTLLRFPPKDGRERVRRERI